VLGAIIYIYITIIIITITIIIIVPIPPCVGTYDEINPAHQDLQ
jgi:hypothetical protein